MNGARTVSATPAAMRITSTQTTQLLSQTPVAAPRAMFAHSQLNHTTAETENATDANWSMPGLIMMAAWRNFGTGMIIFLAGLQAVPWMLHEAAAIDGANGWQRFWRVTLPQLRPTLFLVLTLGLIGTWQVFDQIYVLSRGAPANTTLTPAYLSYSTSFIGKEWGQGSAIAFLLFVVIVVLTLVQRWLLKEKDGKRRSRR